MKRFLVVVLAVVMAISFSAFAEEKAAEPAKDAPKPAEKRDLSKLKPICEVYPLVASKGLLYAKLAPLPEGVALRIGEQVITVENVKQMCNSLPGFLRPQMEKDPFFTLEVQMQTVLMNNDALAWAKENNVDTSRMKVEQVAGMYLDSIIQKMGLKVEQAEIDKLIKSQKVPAEQVEKATEFFRKGLMGKKYNQAVNQIYRELGKRHDIEVSETWVKMLVDTHEDNAIDKLRKSGKPGLVVFLSGMRRNEKIRAELEPIVKKIAEKYNGKAETLILDFGENTVLGMRYGCEFGTPAGFLFFDKKGVETLRNFGYMGEDEIAEEYDKLLKD